jgi:GT2 family glycosyltransferase
MTRQSILIIGVIYNTYPETLRYIESIEAPAKADIKLILVDNSTSPAPVEFIKKIGHYPFIQYIPTGKNLGYFGGAREGLKSFLVGNAGYPDWIFVTNVDICFTPGFFDKLIGTDVQENLGMIAPSIISQKWDADYNPKIPVRYTRKKLRLYQFLYSNFLIQNLFLMGAYLKKWLIGKVAPTRKRVVGMFPGKRKIYAPHGSCMIFTKTYFERGGTLDLANFLFGEEVLVAETCREKGLDINYDPSFVILDFEHASIGFFVSPRMNRYFRESIRNIMISYYRFP